MKIYKGEWENGGNDLFEADNKKHLLTVIAEAKAHSCVITGKVKRVSESGKMTYREKYDEVITSGKHKGQKAKLEALAKINFSESLTREEAVWQALEDYENMTGIYIDPTQDDFDDLVASIIG